MSVVNLDSDLMASVDIRHQLIDKHHFSTIPCAVRFTGRALRRDLIDIA